MRRVVTRLHQSRPSSGAGDWGRWKKNMSLASVAHCFLLGATSSQAEPEAFSLRGAGSFLMSLLVFVISLPPTLFALWLGWTKDIYTIGNPYYDDVLFHGLIFPQPVWPLGYIYCAVFWVILIGLPCLLFRLIKDNKNLDRASPPNTYALARRVLARRLAGTRRARSKRLPVIADIRQKRKLPSPRATLYFKNDDQGHCYEDWPSGAHCDSHPC